MLGAGGQTVRGNLVHDVEWNDFKVRVERREPKLVRKFFDFD
jgi:hypothetical protein